MKARPTPDVLQHASPEAPSRRFSAGIRRARIYATVRKIPRGHVATYGQVAALAGLPGHARQVGYAMAALPFGTDVPWHRVINAQGHVSKRADPWGEGLQRNLLEVEGVKFDRGGVVALRRYQWRPRRRPISSRAR